MRPPREAPVSSAVRAETAGEPAPPAPAPAGRGAVQWQWHGGGRPAAVGVAVVSEGSRRSSLGAVMPRLERLRTHEAAATQPGRDQADLAGDSTTVTLSAATAAGATRAGRPKCAPVARLRCCAAAVPCNSASCFKCLSATTTEARELVGSEAVTAAVPGPTSRCCDARQPRRDALAQHPNAGGSGGAGGGSHRTGPAMPRSCRAGDSGDAAESARQAARAPTAIAGASQLRAQILQPLAEAKKAAEEGERPGCGGDPAHLVLPSVSRTQFVAYTEVRVRLCDDGTLEWVVRPRGDGCTGRSR